MGKLFGNKLSLDTVLYETTGGAKLENWYRRRVSRQAAQLILEQGGKTDADRFFFAMYGVHPEYPRNKRERDLAARHHKVLEQFKDVGLNTVIADMMPPGSEPNPYRRPLLAGVPIRQHPVATPLQFMLERGRDWPDSGKKSEYIRGSVSVPVSNFHRWDHTGDLLASGDTGSIEVFSVGRDKSGNRTCTALLSNILVGLDEIVAAHQFGQAECFANDADFLGCMALITSNMLASGQEGQPGPAAS
jgi:hypothetical protein